MAISVVEQNHYTPSHLTLKPGTRSAGRVSDRVSGHAKRANCDKDGVTTGSKAADRRATNTPRSQAAVMKHAEAPPLDGKKKGTCALAGSPEAVNVLIEKHFAAIGEIAVKHCQNANSDPQRTKELNPDDVVREACEKLTRNWAKVPVEPRFITYVKTLITASPLAGSLEVVQHIIEEKTRGLHKEDFSESMPQADMELRHVEGFNAHDVTQEVCDKLRRNWAKVPVEPGFSST